MPLLQSAWYGKPPCGAQVRLGPPGSSKRDAPQNPQEGLGRGRAPGTDSWLPYGGPVCLLTLCEGLRARLPIMEAPLAEGKALQLQAAAVASDLQVQTLAVASHLQLRQYAAASRKFLHRVAGTSVCSCKFEKLNCLDNQTNTGVQL